MSPTESQLRAALRAGQHDSVDPDAVIAAARGARHDRLVRWGAAAAVVAAVAGIGVAGGVALTGSGSPRAARSANPGAAGVAPPALGAPLPAGGSCPAAAPQLRPPVRGGPGGPVSSGRLFAEQPVTITVCAYSADTGARLLTSAGAPAGTVLRGAGAAALADSLEAARPPAPRLACPLYRTRDAATLALFPVTAAGRALPVVVASVGTNPCALPPVTNGTVARYGWTPPAVLAAFLATLRPSPYGSPPAGVPGSAVPAPGPVQPSAGTPTGGGTVSGSAVRS